MIVVLTRHLTGRDYLTDNLKSLARAAVLADAEAWALGDIERALRTIPKNANGSGPFGADRAGRYNESIKEIRNFIRIMVEDHEKLSTEAKEAYDAAYTEWKAT
jgi:hypothetical protein